MKNDEGEVVDLYIPRKCAWTNKLITAKDHASVQVNIGHLDEEGKYTGQFTTFALAGKVRAQTGNRNQLYRIYNGRRINTTALSGLPTSVIICNQHAREVVSGELCFWLVRLLGQDSGLLLQWPEMQVALKKATATASLARSGAVTKQAMNRFTAGLLAKMKVEVVPVVNQEGRDHIARTFNYDLRKTVSSQVDLNRNCGMWSLMTPWGGVYDYWSIPATTVDKWQTMMNLMQAPFKDTSNKIGIASCFSSTMLYSSQGSSEDTAFKDIGFPYPMTLEVYSPWLLPDSGILWTCPTLRTQQAVCNNQNRCGSSACRDRNGNLQMPSPGKEKTQASAEVVAAAAAELEQLNIAADPYLKGLSTSFSSATFYSFNPATASMYRETVARWIVAILTALDYVVKDLN
eukprot:gene9402-9566_t